MRKRKRDEKREKEITRPESLMMSRSYQETYFFRRYHTYASLACIMIIHLICICIIRGTYAPHMHGVWMVEWMCVNGLVGWYDVCCYWYGYLMSELTGYMFVCCDSFVLYVCADTCTVTCVWFADAYTCKKTCIFVCM